MAASNDRMLSIALFTGSGRTVALPASSRSTTLPAAVLGPHGNRDVLQITDGSTNWELIATTQRRQEFSLDIHADGVLYSAALANFFSMIRREGIYASDSYIDAGGTVWTLRMTVTLTVAGVSRTLTYPSVLVEPEGIKIDPAANNVIPCKFTLCGPTDPSWA